MNIVFSIHAQLPQNLALGFLQTIRDFDARHNDEIHIQLLGVTGLGCDEVESILAQVQPPFPFFVKYSS